MRSDSTGPPLLHSTAPEYPPNQATYLSWKKKLKGVVFALSFYKIELDIFLCSPPHLSHPLPPSPKVPMLPVYSGELVFFYFPRRLDLCMSLLGSSLSGFSGIVICGLVFFALCLKSSYEWIHMIFVFLGLGYLTQYVFFPDPSICLQNKESLFFPAVSLFFFCSIV